ncbi:MAG: hypothetical protein M3391_02585 [Actinomycetota bacterium]|nr:hypothetical protein [Actinomycetota bacterium]
MIEIRTVRELTLDKPSGAANSPHISAASSLVRIGETLYVIADDELYIGIFPQDAKKHGHMVQILDGHLSSDIDVRKKQKPDLESAMLVPPFENHPHGGVMTLGSGSKPDRCNGALLPLDGDGAPAGHYLMVDLEPVYERLKPDVGAVNIEGASVVGDTVRLLQRGNDGDAINGIVDLELEAVLAALSAGEPWPPDAVTRIEPRSLGDLKGVTLCFADSSPLEDDRQVFAASAEDSHGGGDGAIVGSALGVMTPDGDVSFIDQVDQTIKVEGLTARIEEDAIQVLMVTDADDPDTPSPLLEARLPLDTGR